MNIVKRKTKSIFYYEDMQSEREKEKKKKEEDVSTTFSVSLRNPSDLRSSEFASYARITSVLRRYEDVCNEREMMCMMGMVEKKEVKEYYEEEKMNEKNRKIKRIESESEMIKKIQEGKNEVEGTIYSRKEELCMYEYKVYIQGEGIKEIRMREKKEINKKYRFKRYIKEEKGLEVRMELLDIV